MIKLGDFGLHICEEIVGPLSLGLSLLYKENVKMLLRRFLNPSVMITTDNYHERNLLQEKSLEISPIMTLT